MLLYILVNILSYFCLTCTFYCAKHRVTSVVCAQLLSYVLLFAASWSVAYQAPLSWGSLGKNTSMGSHSLLEGIFPTQGLNPDSLLCRQILYHLSQQRSIMEM